MEFDRVILDSNIFVEYVRKRQKRKTAFYRIASRYRFATTAITVFELFYGARTSEARDAVNLLLNGITIFPFTENAAKMDAAQQNRLRTQNNLIEIRDLFIAGIALSHNLPLATFNLKHFQNIPDLDLLEL